MKEEKEVTKKREMFVLMPNVQDTFEGYKVTKDSELVFDNEYVHQELKDLTLKTIRDTKDEVVEVHQETTVHLKEGDLLLIEEENRGYFLPRNARIGTVEDAINEYKFIKERIDQMNGEK